MTPPVSLYYTLFLTERLFFRFVKKYKDDVHGVSYRKNSITITVTGFWTTIRVLSGTLFSVLS
jgi:hypothetical protein